MNADDVIYISLLLGCIGFGYFYRRLDGKISQKKWIGSAIGCALILIVSGLHVAHIVITFTISSLIIRLASHL